MCEHKNKKFDYVLEIDFHVSYLFEECQDCQERISERLNGSDREYCNLDF